MTEQSRVDLDDETPTATLPTTDPPAAEKTPTLLDQMGGPMGFVHSTVPVVVFVVANAFFPLPMTIGVSICVGLALTGFRLLHGERFSSAIGGMLGLAVAVGIVAWTGSAKDFFVIGIWASLVGFAFALGSVLVRRPLTGVVWNLMHGGRHDWRSDRVALAAHDVATLFAAAVFGARFVVKQWLYLADSTTWLAVAKVAMGTPLTVLAALVVVWAFRRTTKRLVPHRT
ncbi:uncharacterized protein DUF3159 [Saccharopolyspora erythraea NRRL 2338]|uniref:DUF3159 domain-containing protein n=2 Tax=Saccharopolyspora erythraea TaxID=1836 RepID=A0ABP3NLS2_SACER|nr:DUF3159 domain-containing protein [Saccharopolyspora erythraea]EQD81817.1 membrane protein [Saccharopolyspora erythraea D]PFG95822.1 uncharacterized protein DUF3159 [Saccharopolyspora erythraea NRRL 2338]QRK92404.1 DUF3159 domain-containing protein [Saccharopolyspora erythraea]CAM02082.1 probable conserved integral membrane alanine and leucine rich protein [Saccharopolyspora erythraea NRRL 2338]